MEHIKNYFKVNENLATSGQPSIDNFRQIAAEGYQVVVNLALASSDNALENEAAVVTGLGMSYIHIPVIWEAPTVDEVYLFLKVMRALQSKKVWVHCAVNMRVSCFVYLYQKHELGLTEDEARYPMDKIWKPYGKWEKLVQEFEAGNSAQAVANG